MCKIMIMPNVKKDKEKLAWMFSRTITPLLSENDSDGLGYAAINSNGHVFGENWLNNKHAFNTREKLSDSGKYIQKMLKDSVIYESNYGKYGSISKKNLMDVKAIMIHARKATCDKTFDNVHPFYRDGTAMIHNGMIKNADIDLPEQMVTSTCDSEVILHEYLDRNVDQNPDYIQDVIDQLVGYYAVGVMTKNPKNEPILDVFKHDDAMLFVTYVSELETIVYCTSKYILEKALKSLMWEQNEIFPIRGGTYIRFNLKTGNTDSILNFKQGPNPSKFDPDSYDDQSLAFQKEMIDNKKAELEKKKNKDKFDDIIDSHNSGQSYESDSGYASDIPHQSMIDPMDGMLLDSEFINEALDQCDNNEWIKECIERRPINCDGKIEELPMIKSGREIVEQMYGRNVICLTHIDYSLDMYDRLEYYQIEGELFLMDNETGEIIDEVTVDYVDDIESIRVSGGYYKHLKRRANFL